MDMTVGRHDLSIVTVPMALGSNISSFNQQSSNLKQAELLVEYITSRNFEC